MPVLSDVRTAVAIALSLDADASSCWPRPISSGRRSASAACFDSSFPHAGFQACAAVSVSFAPPVANCRLAGPPPEIGGKRVLALSLGLKCGVLDVNCCRVHF